MQTTFNKKTTFTFYKDIRKEGFFMEEKLEQVSIEELISYSKQKEVPPVTIIDDLSKENFDYVNTIALRLRLRILLVKNSNKVAFLANSDIAIKLARDVKKRCQVMYYDFARRPSGSITIYALTGYTRKWEIVRNNGYIVKAYNENGEEIEKWIDTDIEEVNPTTLNALGLNIYSVSVYVRGGSHIYGDVAILKHSRKNFLEDGVFNEKRQCYYPKDTATNKEIAEYNKLEKLFKKWGFQNM